MAGPRAGTFSVFVLRFQTDAEQKVLSKDLLSSSMKIHWISITLLALAVSAFPQVGVSQTSPKNPWTDWDFLIGHWPTVQGAGVPGQASSGSFSVLPDLGGKLLVERSHSEYPAANGRPAIIHDDLMIIYPEAGATKAIYFDNENHVIHYDVSLSADKKKVVFLSEKTLGAPQFRLSYEDAGPGMLKIAFEIAPPDKPGQFSKYVEGTVQRKPPA